MNWDDLMLLARALLLQHAFIIDNNFATIKMYKNPGRKQKDIIKQ